MPYSKNIKLIKQKNERLRSYNQREADTSTNKPWYKRSKTTYTLNNQDIDTIDSSKERKCTYPEQTKQTSLKLPFKQKTKPIKLLNPKNYRSNFNTCD